MKLKTLLTMQGVSNYKKCKDIICKVNAQLDTLIYSNKHKLKPIKTNVYRSNSLHLWPKCLNVIFLILLLFLCGCSKSQEITTYKIKKGDHYSFKNHNICANVLEYDIYFDSTAQYDLGNSNQFDVNKLFGFNACNSLHHTNSARFGWVYTSGDSIDIYYYVYDFDVRYFGKICTVKINSWNTFLLQNNGVSYVFKVNGLIYLYEKQSECITSYNYMLYPYFGGDEVAPHDINILFRKP